MRSTRASAAVARLNSRLAGQHYTMLLTGDGKFQLQQRIDGKEKTLGPALALDDFVRFVDAQGPQISPRVTKNDAAFARQLVKKAAR